MTPDLLFQYGNYIAITGWILFLASPYLPGLAERLAGLLIPAMLSVAYAALILAFWSGAEGGFGTLEQVMQLFRSREIALAGWLHYLAFDLFVGAWEARTARAENIPFVLVIPCLALTFLFGPAGLLLFLAIRALRAPITKQPV